MSSQRQVRFADACADDPPQRRPAFYTGWYCKATGGMLHSEAARPWMAQWSPEEQRWMHMSGQQLPQPTQPQQQHGGSLPQPTQSLPQRGGSQPLPLTSPWSFEEQRWRHLQPPQPQQEPQAQPQALPQPKTKQPQRQAQPTAAAVPGLAPPARPSPPAAARSAQPTAAAVPGLAPPARPSPPAAPRSAQPTVTFELATGSTISLQAAPQGAAVSLEATPQDTLLLQLTLPPGGKMSFGLGAGAGAAPAAPEAAPEATHSWMGVGAPAGGPTSAPAFGFNPPAPAMHQPAATEGSQGHTSAVSSPTAPTPGAGPFGAAAAPQAAVLFDTAAEAAGKASGDTSVASQVALSLALKDQHWNQPELPPDWHLTVSQGGWLLRTIRLDDSAASALHVNEAGRAVVLKASGEHSQLVVRLRPREWRAALQLLRRAVTETVFGCRLWSQQGSGLLRSNLLPGAVAALEAAQSPVAGSPGADGSGANAAAAAGGEPAAEAGTPPAAGTSPAGLLHELRAAAPTECLTAQPPAAKRRADEVAGALRPHVDMQASLAQLAELQREAGEVAAGASAD